MFDQAADDLITEWRFIPLSTSKSFYKKLLVIWNKSGNVDL